MRNKFDTFYLSSKKLDKEWVIVDVDGSTLGRVASKIAAILRGKNKPNFQPNMDNGDYVVVVNAGKVKVTGRKTQDKLYHKYTGYPGGINTTNFQEMMNAKPERALELAVKNMLPKGRMGRELYRNLHIYGGAEHPHTAQKPKQVVL
ncbi:MAG: 50S ribosomal protein L13 [Candidatus Margulisbacteria bacterium]|nr:50S ribosomal protein L13 [Candidatus Margulisiibacteriota bacterium]